MPKTFLAPDADLPTIRDDGSGYLYKDEDVDGFADDLRLPTPARVLIARFAAALTPERVTPEQRSLLRGVGPSSLLKDLADDEADLEKAWETGLYDLLTARQHAFLREPILHPNVRSSYPLSISDVAKLSGASERQLRYWEDNGLLRSGRDSAGSRRYFRSAVLRAMAYEQAPQHVRQTLLSILKEGPERFLRLLTAALPDREDLADAIAALVGTTGASGSRDVSQRRATPRRDVRKSGTAKRKTAARTSPASKSTAEKRRSGAPATAKGKAGTARATAKRKTAAKRTTAKRKTAAKRTTAKRKTAAKRTTAKRTGAKRGRSGRGK